MRWLWCLLLVAVWAPLQAKDSLSPCIGGHFNEYYRQMGKNRTVSLSQIKQWSAWCEQGYSATQLNKAIQPCYQDQVHQLRQQAGGYVPLTYEQSQQIKYSCRQQVLESTTPP